MKSEKTDKEKTDREKRKNDPYGCDTSNALDIQASCSTECTGLIPTLPESKDELEHYNDLYPFLPPFK